MQTSFLLLHQYLLIPDSACISCNTFISFQKTGIVGGDGKQREKPASNNSSMTQFDYLRNFNAMDSVSSRFMTEGSPMDANSEKELVL